MTNEEILDPGVYLRGEDPVAVPAPPAGGPVIDEGTYGAWALSLTLAELVGSSHGTSASDGWGGDNYVAWDEADRAGSQDTVISTPCSTRWRRQLVPSPWDLSLSRSRP